MVYTAKAYLTVLLVYRAMGKFIPIVVYSGKALKLINIGAYRKNGYHANIGVYS